MKKKASVGIVISVIAIAVLIIVGGYYAGKYLKIFPQSFIGINETGTQDFAPIGESSFTYFGHEVKVTVSQGVFDGCDPNAGSSCNCGSWREGMDANGCAIVGCYVRNPSCVRPPGYGGTLDYYCKYLSPYAGHFNECGSDRSGGSGSSFYNPAYCKYNISIDGQLTNGNTKIASSQTINKEDFKLKSSTVLESSGGGKRVIEGIEEYATGSTKCIGLQLQATLSIPFEKLDLQITENKITFINNWKDLTGDICLAVKDTQGNIVEAYCTQKGADLKIGSTSFDVPFPNVTSDIMPVINNMALNGQSLGNFGGGWTRYEITTYPKITESQNSTQVVTTTQLDTTTLAPVDLTITKSTSNNSLIWWISGIIILILIATIIIIWIKK